MLLIISMTMRWPELLLDASSDPSLRIKFVLDHEEGSDEDAASEATAASGVWPCLFCARFLLRVVAPSAAIAAHADVALLVLTAGAEVQQRVQAVRERGWGAEGSPEAPAGLVEEVRLSSVVERAGSVGALL